MADVWLGVDLGTTGTRCIAFDADLRILGSAYRENPPRYLAGGRVEQDATTWFDTTVAAIVEVVAQVGAEKVVALSVSSQGITVVPVDERGRALRPAISWLDRRGEELLPELAGIVDPGELTRVTGMPWSGAYTLPKIMWLARCEPHILQKANWLLLPMDYLQLRFTGRAVTDHTMAGGTMAYRLDTQTWNDELLADVGIERGLFPEIAWAGSEAGRLLPEIAQQLGLGEIPVLIGGQDQKCAALAAGVGPAVTTLSLGTSGALTSLRPGPPVPSPVPTFSFLTPGTWVREAAIETAGAAHRWVTQLVSPDGDFAAVERLVVEAGDANGRPMFFPYLSRFGIAADADRWGAEPGGVFWGLGLDTRAGALARTVLEGVSFEIARQLAEIDGASTTIRAFGGGTHSPAWCQILADATGSTIETLSTAEAAAAGAAMLAGAPGRLTRVAAYLPNAGNHGLAQRQRIWNDLRDRIYP